MNFTLETAQALDEAHRASGGATEDLFHFPQHETQRPLYLCGHSLGLQPKAVEADVSQELHRWKHLGVKGHFEGDHPWVSFDEAMREPLAKLVGARTHEVGIANSLTVNLHLLLTSFYRPTDTRCKILTDTHLFPSDSYALRSQMQMRGHNPDAHLITLNDASYSKAERVDHICQLIDAHRDTLALIFLNVVDYKSGEVLDIAPIAAYAKKIGVPIGLGLAHAIGNIPLALHDWDIDFACWCHYKYVNAGPGCVGGYMIHEKHFKHPPARLEGWWGESVENRFKMHTVFEGYDDARAWQLSNPPILSLASLKSALAIFDSVGIESLHARSQSLGQFFRQGIAGCSEIIRCITPSEIGQFGNQITLQCATPEAARALFDWLTEQGVILDYRAPDCVRLSFAPLYNTYSDVYHFVKLLEQYPHIGGRS